MKQVIYNGAMGPNLTAGGVPFVAGESVTVNDDDVAAMLLGKSYFTEATATAIPEPVKVVKITPDPRPSE